jgi:signal peptidase
LAKISITKGVFKDVLIVVIGVIAIWVGLQVAFGTQNPFYVVASGSMVPRLMVYDVLVVQGHEPFEDIKVGDIIVFNRPSDHNKVIVHRVASIIDYNPKTIRTKGDANPASIPGTDFPITEKEYIGKVAYVIPQLGYVTQVLRPPTNYIIIAIVIGIMIAKQMAKKKREKELTLEDPFGSKKESEEPSVEIAGLDKIKKDIEYTKDEKKTATDSDVPEKKSEKEKK